MMACSRPPPPTTRIFIACSSKYPRSCMHVNDGTAADAVERHRHAVLVAGVNHAVVADGAAGLRNVAVTPLRCARSMLSPKGKKASLPRRHAGRWLIQPGALFLARSAGSGWSVKNCCPDAVGQDVLRARRRCTRRWRCRGPARPMLSHERQVQHLGACWRSYQLSAFWPARRVQWMRLCWPAPTPMACPSLT